MIASSALWLNGCHQARTGGGILAPGGPDLQVEDASSDWDERDVQDGPAEVVAMAAHEGLARNEREGPAST